MNTKAPDIDRGFVFIGSYILNNIGSHSVPLLPLCLIILSKTREYWSIGKSGTRWDRLLIPSYLHSQNIRRIS